MANEDAIGSMEALREDRQRYRKECAEAWIEWEQAFALWWRDRPDGVLAPLKEDFMPDASGVMKLEIEDAPYRPGRTERYRVPDGWELWYRIWNEFGYHGNPATIFTIKGRRELKHDLRGHLENEHDAADLCSTLKIDDFYGDRGYPEQCHVWYAAIQAWVQQVKPLYGVQGRAA
jgi:hypothetical protein